jgi:hypothetical protein
MLRRGDVNRVFGAFGEAFERYVDDTLGRMHPSGGMAERVWFGAKGKTAGGDEFEVDALMVEPIGDDLAAIVVETKAVFLREEAILDDVAESFVAELRRRYGKDPGGKERDKGVAQLARIVRAIVDRVWVGETRELAEARAILPVLLTHDARMDSPGVCWLLNEDFADLLGEVPRGWRVAPLILLTIEDLENLESSVGQFTLAELLRDYHRDSPDRMVSFRRFLIGSKYQALIKPSGHIMSQSNEQMEAVARTLFPKPAAAGAS